MNAALLDIQCKRAVVLLSGGADSATLLALVRSCPEVREIRALSFLYGQKHARELAMARWQAAGAGVDVHCVLDLGFFGGVTGPGSALTGPAAVPDLAVLKREELDQPPTYVPNRNMTLLSVAAAYAEAAGVTDVFYGAQAQDRYGYWDCTAEFLARLNHVLALNRRAAVTVHAPFVGMSKAEVVKIGLELGVDYGHTWTCYRGAEVPCGKCPSCVERRIAFEGAGAKDPLTPE